MKLSHLIGGTLLVSGTTIGAGMLALPITTSFVGFFPSLLIFAICWTIMLASSFCFLDVNLSIEGEVNLVTMAEKTLGGWGKGLSWVVYLLLLYSLTAAYIAGGAPLFQEAIHALSGYQMPLWIAHFALPTLFGGFVYLGTLGVDLLNRFLMLGLVASYLLLVGFLPEHIQTAYYQHTDWNFFLPGLLVVIVSFGYHIIIPTLTTYLNHDKKQLRLTLVIGSILPLIIYILWQVMIIGVIPLSGEISLITAWKQAISVSQPLAQIVQNPAIRIGAHFFSFFAIVTSFLGVSLSLSDFLTDGFKLKKTWEGRLLAILLTFVPPLIFVFTYQRGFIIALEYAAAFVAILLIFLPAMMAWQLKTHRCYRSLLGRTVLIFMMLFAFFIVAIDVMEQLGFFKHLIEKYV